MSRADDLDVLDVTGLGDSGRPGNPRHFPGAIVELLDALAVMAGRDAVELRVCLVRAKGRHAVPPYWSVRGYLNNKRKLVHGTGSTVADAFDDALYQARGDAV